MTRHSASGDTFNVTDNGSGNINATWNDHHSGGHGQGAGDAFNVTDNGSGNINATWNDYHGGGPRIEPLDSGLHRGPLQPQGHDSGDTFNVTDNGSGNVNATWNDHHSGYGQGHGGDTFNATDNGSGNINATWNDYHDSGYGHGGCFPPPCEPPHCDPCPPPCDPCGGHGGDTFNVTDNGSGNINATWNDYH